MLIYEFLDDFDRAWFVPEIKTAKTSAELSSEMDTSTTSPAEVAFVLNSDGELHKKTYGVGKVTVQDHSLQSLILSTDNDQDGFLLVSEVYYPAGWSIYMDGETKLKMFAANELIRGIPVPAGQHTLEFVYEPGSVRAGFRITLLSVLILLGLSGFLIYKSRKQSEQA